MNLKTINRLFFVLTLVLIILFTSANLYGQIIASNDDQVTIQSVPQRPGNAVTLQDARRTAIAWLNTNPKFVLSDESIVYLPMPEMLEIKDREKTRTIAYVLQLQPKGWIIVTPDNELNPVIAYSMESIFDSTDTPDNIMLNLLQNDIAERLQALQEETISPSYRMNANALWTNSLRIIDELDQVIVPELPEIDLLDVEHGPFLNSQWNQSTDGGGNPTFNYYTPNNYVCGCVATAMGQICNYYTWPLTGTGSHSYIWDNGEDPAQVLSADFGSTTYDWANILDVYHDGGKTLTQREAVGRLAFDCGISLEMNYTVSGSGAATSRVAFSLKNHFRGSGEYVENAGDFYDRLYNNMVAHRPAQLSIRSTTPDPDVGHSVVIDGVQHNIGNTKYYHLNMGWGGYNDGWYDVENPPFTAVYDWDTINGAVLDIYPTPDLNDPGTTTTNPDYTVSWNVSDNLNASRYELQEAVPNTTLSNHNDDAESGTNNWAIDGNWENTIEASYDGTYAFRGYFSPAAFTSTMNLDKALIIDETTTITYWWYTYYFLVEGESTNARFEISSDGYDWSILRTYTAHSQSWTQETISSAELAAYEGNIAFLRFVVEHPSGYFYNGDAFPQVGFFVDDFAINNGFIEDWTTVNDNILTESIDIGATQSGTHLYRVRAEALDWRNWSDVEVIDVDLPGSESSTQTIPSGDPTVINFDQTQVTMDFSSSPGGEVTVDLIFANPPNAGPLTLPKYWDITSDMTNGTFNLDLQFSYNDDDVSGLNENALIPVYYDDINLRWKRLLNYSLDITNNTMTIHNLDHFTIFAIGHLLEFDFILSDVKIFLESPYSSGSMNTILLDNGDIPLSQPYNVAPWDYNGEEALAAIPEEIVDWILIEIRTETGPLTQITTRAAFLKSDGSIVDLDGISPIGFDDIDASSYYLVIHHRNHLAIMTQSTHGLSESSALYDFTPNIDRYYNSTGATEIETDVWGMWSGDINHDFEITTSDYTIWYNSARAGDSGYRMTDINQDGQVTTSDYTIWYNNARAGASSSVPHD